MALKKQNNNIPSQYVDSVQRFEQAKSRYKESLSSEKDRDRDKDKDDEILLSYLKDNFKNSNKESEEGEREQQLPIPLPVKLDDKTLAHDLVLLQIYKQLSQINASDEKYYKKSTSLLQAIGDGWSEGFDSFVEKDDQQSGWMTKLTGNLLGFFKKDEKQNMATRMEQMLKPINDNTSEAAKILDKILVSGLLVYGKHDQSSLMQTRSAFVETNDTIFGSKKSRNAFSGFDRMLSDNGSFIAQTMLGMSNIMDFFKKAGDIIAGDMKDRKLTDFMGNMSGQSGILGIVFNGLTKIAGIFTGLGSFFGLLLGAGVVASLYALFKHPDQLFGMFKALATLFTDVIHPAFKWVMKELFPPLVKVFSLLLYYGEKLLDVVGTVINKTLIWFIGTALPAMFKSFGTLISNAWQVIKDAFSNIADYFIDIYKAFKDDGFFAGIMKIFTGIPKLLWKTIKSIATGLVNIISDLVKNLFTFITSTDEQSGGLLSGIAKAFLTFFMISIPDFVINSLKELIKLILDKNPINMLFKIIDYFFGTSLSKWFSDTVDKGLAFLDELNPFKFLIKRVLGFFDYILSFIPGWKEMKMFLKSLLPDWLPDRVKKWFEEVLDSNGDDSETDRKSLTDMADDAYQSAKDAGSAVVNPIKKRGSQLADSVDENVIQPVKKKGAEIYESADENVIQPVKKKGAEVYESVKEKGGDVANTIINAPKNIYNNSVTNNTMGGIGNWGKASSSADVGPIDYYLYGL